MSKKIIALLCVIKAILIVFIFFTTLILLIIVGSYSHYYGIVKNNEPYTGSCPALYNTEIELIEIFDPEILDNQLDQEIKNLDEMNPIVFRIFIAILVVHIFLAILGGWLLCYPD